MYIGENTCVIKGTVVEQMTTNDFFDFCNANKTLNFERDENGNIILMSPTGSLTSLINNNIAYQLTQWNREAKTGVVFESNGGFTLPDGSQRAADVAWVTNNKWNALSQEEKEKFAPLCPEFVVELRSKSDELNYLQKKMEMWISNGALEAWLIDTIEKNVYIYSKQTNYKLIPNFSEIISTTNVLQGFQLNLSELKN